MSAPVKVLFVCLGNICRSPTAHGLFRDLVEQHSLTGKIYIESAGTGDWHIGRPPDSRATKYALERGIDLSDLRACLVTHQDFDEFDYVLAMDNQNLLDLEAMVPDDFTKHLGLFLEFAHGYDVTEVPDPYYEGEDGFNLVLDMVQNGCEGLLLAIRDRHNL